MVLNDGTRRYLNSSNLSYITVQVYLVGIFIQIALSELFIAKLNMGISGVGLSLTLAFVFIFLGLNIYPLFFSDSRKMIWLPTREATQDLI